MKKNPERNAREWHALKKTFRMMRLTLFFLLLGIIQGLAIDSYSQQTRISLSFSNAKLVDVLDEIEDQSEYFFMFNQDLIDVNRKVNANYTDERIDEILKNLFNGTDVKFTVNDRQIILSNISESSMQQQKESVSGNVTDSSGTPLPGVSIIIKGTTNGTITDFDGNFTLPNVSEDATLVFSFVGMKTLEFAVGGQSNFNIVMEDDAIGIDEVVAIGYGVKKKASLTGSISTVSSDVLENRPSASTAELLQGVASGLSITRSNIGRIADTDTKINIRGLSGRTDPGVLIVLDGIPQSSTTTYALDQINPNDIESVSVLKDAQAAIYGARAGGGAILITTKRGKTSKPVINASVSYTMNVPQAQYRPTNTLQYMEMMNEGLVNDGLLNNAFTANINYIKENNITFDKIKDNDYKYTHPWPYDNTGTLTVYANTDWHDILFDPALMQNYNISVSGKTEKSNYFTSIGVVDQKGMIAVGENFNRKYFLRVKYDYDVTDYLRLKTNLSLERQKVNEPTAYVRGYGWFGKFENWAGFTSSWAPVYTREGHYYNMGSFENPYAMLKDGGVSTGINNRVKSMLGTQIKPAKNVTIDADVALNVDLHNNDWYSVGYDLYNWREQFSRQSLNNRHAAGVASEDTWHYVGNLIGRYENTFKEKHNVNFMAGISHEEYYWHKTTAERRLGLIIAENSSMIFGDVAEQYNSEEKLDWALKSIFSRLTYDYENKYFLELIYRRDGSSRFAEGYKWSDFYGIQGAWALTNEKFMENVDPRILSFLKIRASIGEAGNQNSIGEYDYIAQLEVKGDYPFGDPNAPVQSPSATQDQLASPERSWEVIETKNFGIDVMTLDNKLSANIDYFIRDNRNMFYEKEFPQVLGIKPPTVNGAHLRSWGWEITMEYRDKVGDFSYNVGFNLSTNDNKVIRLDEDILPGYGWRGFVEGNTYGTYYGFKYDGIIQNETELEAYKNRFPEGGYPNSIRVGDVRYKDLNGDGKLSSNVYELGPDGKPTALSGDVTKVGDSEIGLRYGINLGAQWKGFSFSALFQGVGDWLVYDGQNWWARPISGYANQPMLHYYGNTWTPDNPNAQYPKLSHNWGLNSYNLSWISDAPHVGFNNKYIRLKTIRLGYSLPKSLISKLDLQKIHIYVSGTDVWETRNISGYTNVETPFQKLASPYPRGYSFGINVTL